MTAPIAGILGQAAPGAATNGDLIPAVTAGRRQVISTIVAAETGGAATAIRIFARKAGAAAAVGNAIAYDVAVAANSTTTFTIGAALAATDVVTVRSTSGAVTFTAFGEETDVPAA